MSMTSDRAVRFRRADRRRSEAVAARSEPVAVAGLRLDAGPAHQIGPAVRPADAGRSARRRSHLRLGQHVGRHPIESPGPRQGHRRRRGTQSGPFFFLKKCCPVSYGTDQPLLSLKGDAKEIGSMFFFLG